MSARRHLKSGLFLTLGSVAASLASFARNIIVARLISVDDFGIAATFAMTMSLIEMASNLGLDRMLVQDDAGDDDRFQASCQAFQAARGAVGSVIMFAVAGPVASLFGIPEVAWAFRVLAVVPLIRGLAHLDLYRAQRGMRFGPSALVDAVPQLLLTAAAAPLALWLDDYRVMLWLVVAQVVLTTAATHAVAKRPYRWAWDPGAIRRMITFGWPLLINGFLMFGIFQGDRAIVGAFFSMETLGWFSAAFSLTLMPSMIAAKVLQSFLMPMIVRVRGDERRLADRSQQVIAACAIVGAALGVGGWVCGSAVLELFYGERYRYGSVVVGWLAMMQGARLAKAGPAIVAMAIADSRNPMFANVVRGVGVAGALFCAVVGGGVVALSIIGLVAEGVAFVSALVMLTAGGRVKVSWPWLALAPGVIAAVVAAVWSVTPSAGLLPWHVCAAGVFAAVLCAAIAGAVVRPTRAVALGLIRRAPGVSTGRAPISEARP